MGVVQRAQGLPSHNAAIYDILRNTDQYPHTSAAAEDAVCCCSNYVQALKRATHSNSRCGCDCLHVQLHRRHNQHTHTCHTARCNPGASSLLATRSTTHGACWGVQQTPHVGCVFTTLHTHTTFNSLFLRPSWETMRTATVCRRLARQRLPNALPPTGVAQAACSSSATHTQPTGPIITTGL